MHFLLFFIASLAFGETVYVDGIFDLAHYGHQRAFQKARDSAAEHFDVAPEKIKIVVGVCGGDIKSYKREPVFTLEQRVAQIQSFKGVDLVIPNAPLTFDGSYVEKYQIDLVMHGDDYSQQQIETYYSEALKRGIFKTYPYEPGISTTQILRRTTQLTLQSLLEKNNLDCTKKESIEATLKALEETKI